MTFPLTDLARPSVPPALTVTTTTPRIAPRPASALRPGSKEFRAALAEKQRDLAALAAEVARMERADARLREVRERGAEVAA